MIERSVIGWVRGAPKPASRIARSKRFGVSLKPATLSLF